jgi:hypothetical protein
MTLKPLALGAAFCALTTPALTETFVIVQGALQTAAAWQATAGAMRAVGETVATIDARD